MSKIRKSYSRLVTGGIAAVAAAVCLAGVAVQFLPAAKQVTAPQPVSSPIPFPLVVVPWSLTSSSWPIKCGEFYDKATDAYCLDPADGNDATRRANIATLEKLCDELPAGAALANRITDDKHAIAYAIDRLCNRIKFDRDDLSDMKSSKDIERIKQVRQDLWTLSADPHMQPTKLMIQREPKLGQMRSLNGSKRTAFINALQKDYIAREAAADEAFEKQKNSYNHELSEQFGREMPKEGVVIRLGDKPAIWRFSAPAP